MVKWNWTLQFPFRVGGRRAGMSWVYRSISNEKQKGGNKMPFAFSRKSNLQLISRLRATKGISLSKADSKRKLWPQQRTNSQPENVLDLKLLTDRTYYSDTSIYVSFPDRMELKFCENLWPIGRSQVECTLMALISCNFLANSITIWH